MIEPIKSKFKQCKKIRSNKNFFFNSACVSSDYNDDTVELIYSNLRTITNDDKNQIKAKYHLNNEDLNIYQTHKKILAKARTLNSILKEAKAPKKIDFLSIDTEGYEIEILKGLDFNNFFFDYILIETKSFEILDKFLNQRNYIFLDKLSNHDYLYKRHAIN